MTTISPVPKPSSAHSDLERDLEVYFRQKNPPWIVAREVDLGSRSMDKEVKRADVMAMSVTYPPRFVIVDAKVSKADLQRGIRAEQHLIYAEFCHRFYYATPFGLITENDLPDGCSWLQQTENGKWFTEEWLDEENRSFKMPEELWHSFAKKLGG